MTGHRRAGRARGPTLTVCGLGAWLWPIDGTKVRAYNLGCRKARSIYGRQPPKGWTAANVDVAGGLAFYCHADELRTVDRAIDRRTGRVHVRRLHGAPLIIARVRYGE